MLTVLVNQSGKFESVVLRVHSLLLHTTVRGKNLEGENFGEFGEWCTIRQIFPRQ